MIFSFCRQTVLTLFAAITLIGFAHLTIMPPFEGFDESAHYSRLEATAYGPDAQLKSEPSDKIAADLDEYQEHAPVSRLWLSYPVPYLGAAELAHRVLVEDTTYTHFFADEDRVKDYIIRYRQSPAANSYKPGIENNWEYQHPPLYYELLAPLMHGLEAFSLVDRILVLRSVNYLLAVAGVFIGMFGTLRYLQAKQPGEAWSISLLSLLYPFIAPGFWGEFARIGNDNLCLLLFAISWTLLLRHFLEPASRKLWIMLGISLGLNLLTKATLMPPTIGILGFIAARQLFSPETTRRNFIRRLSPAIVTGLACAAIGSIWYISNAIHGTSVGSLEIGWMLHDPEFMAKLHKNLSAFEFMRGIRVVLISAIYHQNSLSMALPAIDVIALTLATMSLVFAVYLWGLRNKKPWEFEWLPLWALIPLLAGLSLHVVYSITEMNGLFTPGRYFFELAPCFMFIVGSSLDKIARRGSDRLFIYAVFFVALLVNLYAFWSQAAIFGGCALREGLKGPFSFGPYYCLDQFGMVFDHIGVLAAPVIGFGCFALGWLALACGLWRLICMARAKTPPLA